MSRSEPGIHVMHPVAEWGQRLPDRLVSERLDENGRRIERIRERLTNARLALACLTYLMVLPAVTAIVFGGSERTEKTVFAVTLISGAVATYVLELAAYLVGQRNAEWWRPRLKEVLPGDSDPSDGDGGRSRRVSRKRSERRASRRLYMAEQVRSRLREVRIYERRRDGAGTLLSEPILVLGRGRHRTLDVFDQEGNELGSIVRVLEKASKSEGDVWVAEIREADGQVAVTVRLAPRRRRAKDAPIKAGSYAIGSADGRHLATVGPPQAEAKRSLRTVTVGGDVVAHLEERGKAGLTVTDAERRKIADITTSRGSSENYDWYVVNRIGVVEGLLADTILAAAVIWDERQRSR